MTRLRTESQLGWGLCQFIGETCLPSVTVDAQKRAEARERRVMLAAFENFWWLSYANDEGCAGVAIVRLTGEQTTERAAERARQLGLEPKGEWEIAAIAFPADGDEAELALMARHADRFFTTTEAEGIFAAQSIGSFEEETGRTVDTSGVGVSHTKEEL